MQFKNLLYIADDAVATITINRPKALNALNQETLEEMLRCFRELAQNEAIRVVIITGGGDKAFVAGADIAFMEKLSPLAARCFALLGQQVLSTIENLPQPVIAAINGFALGGGCELALACDIRLASENARFGQPEVNLGVLPGFGGSQRLPRLIGRGRANELLFTGDIIDAREAARIGLINRVVPQAQLLPSCREMAEKIASRGPVAIRLCKEAVNNGVEIDLARACQYEADQLALCFSCDEQKEGMRAFLEKRPAKFHG
ncbi:enoyl-CoA hydratase-related protein [Desulfocastanea catecholica]